MTPARQPLIVLEGICRSFITDGVETIALNGIDLTVNEGDFIAIMGASGSGKSTLMNILGCMDRPSAGIYRLAGQNVAAMDRDQLAQLRREEFGFIFQNYNLIPTLNALENVQLPALYLGWSRETRQRQAAEILRRLGLGEREFSRPSQLSGGQQQRVSIARALLNGGKIILADEPTGALDSKNGSEVMEILTDIAASGRTVILITHDPKVAAFAHRIVEIEDGLIVRESTAGASRAKAALPANSNLNTKKDDSGPTDASQSLGLGRIVRNSSLGEASRSAFAALKATPMRTALTLLGVVIGVASIVSLLAIGRGTEVELINRISAIGTNWILVESETDPRSISTPLTRADASAISELPNVLGVVPSKWATITASYGSTEARTEIVGTLRSYTAIHQWGARLGTFFTEDEEREGAAVVLLGQAVADKLFPNIENPSGQEILIERAPFVVIGVLETKGIDTNGDSYDNRIVAPLTSVSNRIYGNSDLNHVVIAVADMNALPQTKERVRLLLMERHGREDFWLQDTAAASQKAAESRAVMNMMLVSIAGISLLVGGIGIMNMMLTTVRERTREIGIRIAMGATVRQILGQFVIEAAVLSGVGGFSGLVIGSALGICAALLFGMTVIFSVTAGLLVLAAAFALGMIAGLAPAVQAARLDPVAALHNE